MSYTPTTWNTGDTITASALNKIEQGIADGGGAKIIVDTDGTLNKTYAEIYDLILNGVPCFISCPLDPASDLDDTYAYSIALFPIVAIYKYESAYRIMASATVTSNLNNYIQGAPGTWTYQASSSQGYPTFLRKANSSANTSSTGHYLSMG